jgi:hypothetical protein
MTNKIILLILLASCCNEPCKFVCDKTEDYVMVEYNVALKMAMSTTKTRCLIGHYEQNSKSKWKCAGRK